METTVLKKSIFIIFCCNAFFMTSSCGWFGVSTKSTSGKDVSSGQKALSVGQTISVKVNERDLLLPDEVGARKYLNQKLIALMTKELISLGFDGKTAASMATSAQKKDIFVRGHMEKIMGQGKDAGKIYDENLWDVRGQLQIVLSSSRLDELYKQLESRPLSNMEHVMYLESVFHNMQQKRINTTRFESLMNKTAEKWFKLLYPWEKRQFEIPVAPLDAYLKTLNRVRLVLEDFHKAHPDHPGFATLEKTFTLAAIKAVRSIKVQSENFTAIKRLLDKIQKMAGKLMPGLMAYIKRDLELAWRDYLVSMDDKKESFLKMREGFVFFLELFPESKFYPDLELRFLSRWYDHLVSFVPKDLHGLEEMLRQDSLFHKRFPTFDGLKDVDNVVGKRCVSVLSRVNANDLDFMARINNALSQCESYLPAGNSTVRMRERLERLEQKLTDARDDRQEQKALSDLNFFVQWDKAIESLPWGAPKKKWNSEKSFMEKWNSGKDAGSECRCTLDPEEPCRIFNSTGLAGGFEVVVRFSDDRLSGVDLCEVYTGDKLEAIYRFFARRYRALHSGRQAAMFLAGTRNDIGMSFVKGDKIHVTLERSTDTCTIRYRSVKMMSEVEKREKEKAAKQAKDRARARKERIEKGWNPGQCVRWECRPVCQYQGRTKTKSRNRYMVTITNSRKSPTEEGSEVWVDEDDLYDCQ